MEKKIEQLGKRLTREEMKQVTGGSYPCKVYTDCPNYCTGDLEYGYMCISGICQYHICP